MSESAGLLTFGLVIGTIFGLVLAVVLSRLATKVRGLARLFGRDVQARRLAELEKENAKLARRLQDKDEYIRKAMESLAQDSADKEEAPSAD